MPLRFTLRQLEYFVTAGECGSIAAASEKLSVSSPSISASITQLEAELGVTLFVRKRAHGLTLTSAGSRMLAQSRAILSTANDLNRLAGELSGTVQGPLRLGCLSTFAQIVVPRLRVSFEAAFEAVNVCQFEMNQSDIFSALRRAEIDIALTYDLEIPADLEFTRIIDMPALVVLSPEHPLAGRAAISIPDLTGHSMVLLDLPHSADYFLSFFAKHDLKPTIGERTRDMAVMRSLVANGFGYSIANLRPLNDLSPDGKPLVFVPLVDDVSPIHLGLVTAPGVSASPTVRAFSEHCKAAIQKKHLPGLGC